METNYFTVRAVLRTDKTRKDGTCPIHIVLQRNNVTQKFSSSEFIEEKYWDKNTEQGIGKGFGNLNAVIKKKKQKLEDFIRESKSLGKSLSKDEISNFWNGKSDSEDDLLFSKFYESFCKRHFLTIKESTQIHYVTLGKKLKYFKPNLKLSEIDYSFMIEFDNYLIETNSGRYNMIKFLKRALKEAVKLDVLKNESWKGLQNVSPRIREEYLTVPEINQIIKCDLSLKKHLELTRNMFLFSCYTGMRFSDVVALKKENYKNGIITLRQIKTNVDLKVPVNVNAKKIICKFYNQREDDENIFPTIENQTVNRYLKTIGEIAEIKKKLHFHLARHTFGTTLLNNNVNVFYISKMMGHKKLSQTYSYTGVDVTQMKNIMNNVNFNSKN
ncbi:site-specific integrase [Flavobacterium daemonense]|uniref:site-specific integrase n=1 Tax=Flavobacterium daemonense TaxID=1393049 RepID=UPI001186C219|nr:site-specific integrase [Flavobacterium daemonense]KAF2336148.1 site-specific integrase [Flavobacterium daemonense]